jgi:hypothetical protein
MFQGPYDIIGIVLALHIGIDKTKEIIFQRRRVTVNAVIRYCIVAAIKYIGG